MISCVIIEERLLSTNWLSRLWNDLHCVEWDVKPEYTILTGYVCLLIDVLMICTLMVIRC